MLESTIGKCLAHIIYSQAFSLILGTLGGSYLLWRLWAFTFKPMLRPDEPKPLPYWIPFLGRLYCKTLLTQTEMAEVTGPGHTYYFMTNPDQLFKLG